MKNLIKTLLILGLLSIPFTSNAQLLDGLFNKEKKEKKQKTEKIETPPPGTIQDKGEVAPTNLAPAVTDKKFSYKCYTLNTDVEMDAVKGCTDKEGQQMITDTQYYEQGEDLRMKEKNNSTVTLSFLGDTKRLMGVSVEDIEDISTVQQLQQQVLTQMGNPTMGYEMMKNYDGNKAAAWANYSTYEFVYRYVIGLTAYDFRVTQFGAKMKNGKIIHTYSFSATVNKKAEVSSNPDETKVKTDFYPPIGVQQVDDYTVESRMLRKW